MFSSDDWPEASVETRLETPDGICVLSYNPLDAQEIIASVGDNQAGATAVFIGTTRNSFKGNQRRHNLLEWKLLIILFMQAKQ